MSNSSPNPFDSYVDDTVQGLPPLLRTDEAAKVLRVSTRTIRSWVVSGRLRSTQVVPGGTSRRLIPRKAIAELLLRSTETA